MPINPSLLIHSCILHKKTGEKNDFGADVTVEIPLKKVRIDLKKTQRVDNLGEVYGSKGILFFDHFFSKPKDQAFKVGDKITFLEETLTVRGVTPSYGRKIHHWEVGLE